MRSSLRLLFAALVMTIALGTAAGTALAAPANDNFADAEQLSGHRGTATFDLTEATSQAQEPLTGSATDRTVWFRYEPTESGIASFSTCRVETDLVMDGGSIAAYTGSSLSQLTSAGESTGGCLNGRVNATLANLSVTAGETYWIQLEVSALAEVTGGTMIYDFNTVAPTNDNFADAAAITAALPQTVDADTGLATIEDTEPNIEDWGPRNSLWWKWTAVHDGVLSIDTCSSNVAAATDSRIHVFTDENPDPDITAPAYFSDNDDGCAAPTNLLSHLYIPVQSDQTYFIRVSNYNDDFGGAYELTLRWVTEPELLTQPKISPSDARLSVGQTAYGVASDWFADPPIDEETYQWKRCDADGTNCADIGGETGPMYIIQAADLGHRLVFSSIAHVGLSTASEDSDPSGLVEGPPDNDNFADATDIGSTAPASVVDDNFFATSEDGENSTATLPVDHSVWYRWTAPETMTYVVGSCQSEAAPNFRANVYVGNDVSGLTATNNSYDVCADATQGRTTYFAATAGVSYLIQAGSDTGEGPTEFALTISEAPLPSFADGPRFTGNARENSILTLAERYPHNPIPVSVELLWTLCDTDGNNCTDRPDLVTNEAAVDATMVGKRVKATVTYTNANGSVSQSVLSDVVEPDADGDGVIDPDDTCPTEPGARTNGCPPSDIVGAGAPVVTGNTFVGQQLSSSTGIWTVNHDPLAYTLTYKWQRCASADSCVDIPGATGANHMLVAADKGSSLRAVVVATNADDDASQTSALTSTITDPPVTPPPPAPVDPFPAQTLPKSLGKLKLSKKNTVTLSKLSLTCGATATGPCTGMITFTTPKVKKKGKIIKSSRTIVKLSVSPGSTMPTTFKLSAKTVKAVNAAKSLKTSIVIQLGAPGFSSKSLPTAATLSLK